LSERFELENLKIKKTETKELTAHSKNSYLKNENNMFSERYFSFMKLNPYCTTQKLIIRGVDLFRVTERF
jgi:hypothetical protein